MDVQLSLFGELGIEQEAIAQTPVEILRNRPEPNPQSPVIVSYGGGRNSTALLIAMVYKGWKPDLILFADTGAEMPETYEFLDIFSNWLVDNRFPAIEVCRYEMKSVKPRNKLKTDGIDWKSQQWSILDLQLKTILDIQQTVKYETLEDECLLFKGLPAKAYGRSDCSVKWKLDPVRKYTRSWMKNKGISDNVEIRSIVGIHAGEISRLFDKSGKVRELTQEGFRTEYPLIEWDIDQAGCEALIRSAGLSVPPKSSCFFCPNRKLSEVIEMKEKHPDLFERACYLEENARLDKIHGLGRRWAWSDIGKLTSLEQSLIDLQRLPGSCVCVD